MKTVRLGLVWAALGVVILGLLVSFMPASWGLAYLGGVGAGVRLAEVSGTVWRGQAGQVWAATGQNLGRLQWQLAPATLFGHPALHLQLHGAGLDLLAELRRETPSRWIIEHAQLRSNPISLQRIFALAYLGYAGPLYLEVNHAVWVNGWPWQLEAQLSWRDASYRAGARMIRLGNLTLHAHSQQGLLRTDVEDDGSGPVQIHGQAEWSPLAWQVSIDAAARTPDPDLDRWLAGFGVPDEHGMVHLHRNGGLLHELP